MTQAYVLHGVVLPHGTSPEVVGVCDGRVVRGAAIPEGAQTLPAPFIAPGLVDAHAHIAYAHERQTLEALQHSVVRRLRRYHRRGVLLVRDMGSCDDGLLTLAASQALPGVLPAGRILLREQQEPFVPTAPDALVATALEQVRRGARWIKIVADWAHEYRGRDDTGHSGFDEPVYPPERIIEVTRAVHAAGARVALHCFTEHGAHTAVEAGVDSLEHGWGLTRPLIDALAKGQTAWVPTVSLAPTMQAKALEYGEDRRAAWIDEAMARLRDTIPYAYRQGVPILVGTDWFPAVTVGQEIAGLVGLGLSGEAALAAGTTTARRFLGAPILEHGAPADLVIFHRDPREHLDELNRPAWVFVNGVLMETSPGVG